MATLPQWIEARVIQKISTEAEWNAITLVPYKGEFCLVGDSGGKVTNIKVGDGINVFSDLEYMFDSIQQNVNYIPYSASPEVEKGFTIVGGGTHGSITVPSGEAAVLFWDGTVWSLASNIEGIRGQNGNSLLPLWESDYEGGYPEDAQVRDENGNTYVSLVNSNTAPLNNALNWQAVFMKSNFVSKTNETDVITPKGVYDYIGYDDAESVNLITDPQSGAVNPSTGAVTTPSTNNNYQDVVVEPNTTYIFEVVYPIQASTPAQVAAIFDLTTETLILRGKTTSSEDSNDEEVYEFTTSNTTTSLRVCFRNTSANPAFYKKVEEGTNFKGYVDDSIENAKDELNQTINESTAVPVIEMQQIVPFNSRFDENTPVSGSAWGVRGGAELSKPETDYIRVERTATSPSGLINTTIMTPYEPGQIVDVEITARLVSGSPDWALILNTGYVAASHPSMLHLPLNSEWQTFRKTMSLGSQNSDKRIIIQQFTAVSGASIAEFKDIVILAPVDTYKPIVEVTEELKDEVDKLSVLFPEQELVSVVADSIGTASGTSGQGYEWTVLPMDVGNTIQYHPTLLDFSDGLTIGGVAITEEMVGNLTSFTPNSSDIGKNLGRAPVFNSLTINQIWSGIACNKLGWTILQNSAWSGRTLSYVRSGALQWRGSQGIHDRTINTLKKRDSEGNWILPTKIILALGTNDFSYTPYAIVDNQYQAVDGYASSDLRLDGTIGFKETISVFIKKCREAYPLADIVLCTLINFKRVTYDRWPTRNPHNTIIDFNNAIRECADIFGCGLIEFDKCGITFENIYPTYSDESATPTHPNATGHAKMAEQAIKDLAG